MGEFEGRVALVTGGAGAGIGGHTTQRLLKEGAKVVVVDIHERRTKEIVERLKSEVGGTIVGHVADIADRPAVDKLLAAVEANLGPVDILVNNAAENVLAPMREFEPKDWDRVMAVDLTAGFYLIRKTLPSMCQRRRGSIVNVSSLAGWQGDANEGREGPYACSKAGLFALTRSVAYEAGPFGVRCNAVAPGIIWTKFVAKYEDQFKKEIDRTPMRRFGKPDDVVEAIVFLLSDRASFITGEAINVSGGWWMCP
jgi:3-oxoacyl-[acyl-carrier protein] reductase